MKREVKRKAAEIYYIAASAASLSFFEAVKRRLWPDETREIYGGTVMSQDDKARPQTQGFFYERVSSLADALSVAGNDRRRILAGGTDLLLKIKHGTAKPGGLLDITRIEELRHIGEDGDVIRIGACVTITELLESDLLRRCAPTLCTVAGEIGSVEVRNVGTVGGNLCCARANCGTCFLPGCGAMTGDQGARPCQNAAYSDLLLPLSAYDAVAVLKNRDGERSVQVRRFLKTNGSLDLKPDEILTEVSFRKPVADGWGYARLRQPTQMGLPFVSVIAVSRGGVFDLTIGGSAKYIHTFEKISGEGMAEKISAELLWSECLYFSQDYRRRITPAVIREAVNGALEERER